MERTNHISVSALNISASPHPKGIYERLIAEAAEYEVALGGSDYAQITKPEYRSNQDHNIVHGRICVWTPISKDGDWYDKKTKDKATSDQKRLISIPENIEPNYRFFYYAFDLKRHLLIFETKNSDRQYFSPLRAAKMFEILFDSLPEAFGDTIVAVNIIPQEGTVEKILALPKLRHLKIVVTRPNPEDLSEEYNAIMEKMRNEKIKTYAIELTKASKVDRIEPDQETTSLAKISGAGNGYVEGKEAGKPKISTRDFPKKVPIDVPESQSALVRFFSAFRLF